MSKVTKTLDRVLRGTADANISFDDLCSLLRHFGFEERIRGSHHIFTRDEVKEILNLQPKAGKAKPYQVKQVRNVIVSYELAREQEMSPEVPHDNESDTTSTSSEEANGGQDPV